MNKAVFLHMWIPDDPVSQMWPWWIDYYIGALNDKLVGPNTSIHVHISMPCYRTKDYKGMQFIKNGKDCNFEEKVREYIQQRYRYVQSVFTKDHSYPNTYEGFTLDSMWNWAQWQPDDTWILYIHSKGVRAMTPEVKTWVDGLMDTLVLDCDFCMDWLKKGYDIVAVGEERNAEEPIVSGNMFWTTAKHVKGLIQPSLLEVSEASYGGVERYKYERWIKSSTAHPKTKIIRWFTTDPYTNYVF